MAPPSQRRDTLSPEYQKLAEKYVPMAKFEARKLFRTVGNFFDYDTLEAESLFGLVDAVSRYPAYCVDSGYDPTNLDYFQYYVTKGTRGHLLDFLRQQNHLTRTEYDRAKEIKAKLDDQKSLDEIANELNLDTVEVRKTLANVRDFPLSLNLHKYDPVANSDSSEHTTSIESLVSLNQLASDEYVLAKVMMEKLTAAFDTLDQIQKTVLTLRYFCNVSVRDTGDMMEISSMLVNKIQADALEILISSVRSEF